MAAVPLWGGIECSIRRIGDTYSNQLQRSGHLTRLSDLDRIAELGLQKLRYPVLWEQIAPHSLDEPDWRWPDERLARLRELGIDPIVGLVHHGSGPRYTALDQADFAPQLARYARLVAERYPWVTHFTPINEPLTTARFSGLYGFWYPHGHDDATFVRILLNQLKATRLAMLAIREVTPAAKLVQTEDLGQTHSTPALAYQAEFENHRRWLTYDLLCGRVNEQHPLWGYLRHSQATEAELHEFVQNPLPPDIIGLNYYVTSERYLDEELHHYPAHCAIVGGNGRDDYADVEAVRVGPARLTGIQSLLTEAWTRYQLPLAVTEAHLACTREEQMRWVHQTCQAANALRAEGVQIEAVTVWSLLGAFDWNSLLTRDDGHYETGVFDVRGGQPRPTALFNMVRSLARHGHYDHPVLRSEGWWQRDVRLHYRHHCHI
ncbi:glycoside hydrolase family 1 [Hymenobacter roseosalivarius DSM 11622]|uniref:Glycoside hydrolase family 1 n=1 Tax=Hymenobacter roseosalivarius DSM 11622 TaxID=645990 RepID=A0A1W1VSV0_9BACT|nr:family 1 glycosylhydrolase [Hymenobacter roseosalivarius]SMB96455.1 glycoside hydrolase family 1 [Hymenobacter roseosalivarius DSM 11622]